jgi:HEAT repeat protein
MRTDFRVATGTGMVLLLALCVCARGAQQRPASAQPPAVAQPKPGSTAAAASAKPGAAPSVASVVSQDAATLSPAAASRKAWKCLNDGLAEKNYNRRAQAIAALGTIGLRRDAVSLIEGGLNDKDSPVRQAAADVLGTMKSRGSIPKLRAALDDNSAVVSFAAAQALWTMGDRSGQDLFLEVLVGDRKISTGLVRGGLQQLHEALHDPKALAELGSEQAAGALLGPAGFGVTAAIELAKDKAAPARAISARLLADDTSDDAREVLREALQDKSWIVRAAAAQALGVHGSLNDVTTLAPLLDDQQKEVRYRAAAAIIRATSRRAS